VTAPALAATGAGVYGVQQAAVRRAVDGAQDAFAALDLRDLDATWTGEVRPRVVAAVEAAQVDAAASAAPYVAAVLLAANAVSAPVGRVVAGAFAGLAANGLTLAALLDNARAYLRRALAADVAPSEARALALSRALTYVATEVADAGRLAVQAAMIAEPAVAGYERVVRLPACGRCLILAGRLYRHSEGFLRHPRCDCGMRPVTAEQWRTTNPGNAPQELFARMSRAQQDKAFGRADAAAIRAGADMARVVNARRPRAVYVAGGREFTREATTARGLGRQLGGRARPTAAQIVNSTDDRDELAELLRRFGYLTR
jgi:hypothetical protein